MVRDRLVGAFRNEGGRTRPPAPGGCVPVREARRRATARSARPRRARAVDPRSPRCRPTARRLACACIRERPRPPAAIGRGRPREPRRSRGGLCFPRFRPACHPVGRPPARAHHTPGRAGRMRMLQAWFTDPVSFAVLSGSTVAVFPSARGWCASDWARRAVAERRAWLHAGGSEQATPSGWTSRPDALEATRARHSSHCPSRRASPSFASMVDALREHVRDALDRASRALGSV